MANYHVKGSAVPNATSYELAEKSGTSYTTLATENEIDFDLSTLSFADGNHTLVVRAKADGYTTSDWSNGLTYTVGNGGGGETETIDLSGLTLAHCYSASCDDGSLGNLSYDPDAHELSVLNGGWYRVSYFTQALQVGMEVEFNTHYGSGITGNFIGIYLGEDLVDGVAEKNGSFWPAPTPFGIYAPGVSSEPLYQWHVDCKKTAFDSNTYLGNALNDDVAVKIQLTTSGPKFFISGAEVTLIKEVSLTKGVNYYLGFHSNRMSTGSRAVTMTYMGAIR